MAAAEAEATTERAAAQKGRLLAEAEGRAALIAAENAQSPELIAMKLDEARLKALPDVVERMMKPAEKIETIRINQVTGFGAAGGGGEPGGEKSAVNAAVEGVLSMALQLPAVKALGEEIGINVGGGLAGVAKPLERPGRPAPKGGDGN
jgi:uncharacterized membrane protein YqiK